MVYKRVSGCLRSVLSLASVPLTVQLSWQIQHMLSVLVFRWTFARDEARNYELLIRPLNRPLKSACNFVEPVQSSPLDAFAHIFVNVNSTPVPGK